MKRQILSTILALCLCMSAVPTAHAWHESPSPQEDLPIEAAVSQPVPYDSALLTRTEVYEAMIALKDEPGYLEGTTWTDDTPYSGSNPYRWNGGTIDGKNIVATGCVAFAFILSDVAFGNLPARTPAYSFEDVKVGDILRMNTDTHTVIVLEVNEAGVVVAEGNYSGKVHWGRAISKETLANDVSRYITRYLEGWTEPDDPAANETLAEGTLDGGLSWKLIKAGTLTISGTGAMPDWSSAGEQPWSSNADKIRNVVIEKGVTAIGACSFWNTGVLSVSIPDSVTAIGDSAFRESALLSAEIPSSVKTIGDSAFQTCKSLTDVTLSEGLETISQYAFRACTGLTSIKIPASVSEVGAGAFMECSEMTGVNFAPGDHKVTLGDNLFTQCYKLMGVTLPKKADCIGAGMFQNDGMLPGVIIPEGVASIGTWAFASSGVSVVYIPKTVTQIETAAFSNCGLKDIYYGGSESEWSRVSKLGDTAASLSGVTIHYNSTPDTGETAYTITFNANGGTVSPGTAATDADGRLASLPTPTRDGFTFNGWFTAAVGGERVEASKIYTGNTTLYAQWTENGGTVTPPSGHTHAWSDTWTTSATHHWHSCTASGCPVTGHSNMDGYAAHIIGDWVTDKQPTATAEGSRYKACTVCGYELERETIPATGGGASFDGGSTGGNTSSGGPTGGSSSGSSSNSATTTKNPDGSTTTTATDRVTGTVTETTTRPDGSKLVLETQKDGIVTSTKTAADGSVTETVTRPDGSGTLSIRQADGTTVQASTAASGAVTAEVTLSSGVQTGGAAVALPVPELIPGRDTVTVHTGNPQPVKVTLPTASSAPSVVAVVIDPDGREQVLKFSVPTEGGITAAVPNGATVKLVDNSKDFSDTASHWAEDAAAFVSSRELFTGTGEGEFSPEETMTRAMSMTVLARLAGADVSGGANWYQKSMEWAVAQGLSDGNAPEAALTREQLITMLYRYAGSPAATNKELHFSDEGAVSGYALEAMYWGVENGILNGYGNGILAPGNHVTRAQAASMLMRLVDLLGK